MSEAVWYIPDQDNQSTGPYTAHQIIQSFKKGLVKETTLCWREGMTDWQQLYEVEPFDIEVRLAKAAAKQRIYRIALMAGLAVCIVIIGVVAYTLLMGPKQIRRGRKLIAAGLYTEAVQTLEPYVKRKPLKAEAAYLLAVASVNSYATADTGQSEKLEIPSTTKELFGSMKQLYKQASTTIQKNPLAEAKQLFLRAFKANPEWREKARIDLAEAMARIPATVDDSPARALAISQLRVDLALANSKQLAADLLDRAITHRNNFGRTALENELFLQILNWDLSLSERVVSIMLPEETLSPRRLNEVADIFLQFIQKQPSLKKVLSDTLLQSADKLLAQDKYEQAEAALTVIARINPNMLSQVAQRRTQYLTQRLKAGDAIGVVQALDRTADESPQMKAAAPAIYIEAARKLKQNNIDEAKKAVAKALSLNPDGPANEQDALLCIELAPKIDETKLTRCKSFIVDYPDSPNKPDVLMTIVTDAVTFFDQQSRWRRSSALPHLQAALDAANTLTEQYPEIDNLDNNAFELAKRLAENKQQQDALDLMLNVLKTVYDSEIKSQIVLACTEWQQQLDPNKPRIVGFQPPKPKPPSIINTADKLQKALSSEPIQKIMWVALTKEKAGDQNYQKLKEWVRNGGVLWAETDIATSFLVFSGSGLREVTPPSLYGQAVVPVDSIKHPIVSSLSGTNIGFELRPGSSAIIGRLPTIFQNMLPLLIQPINPKTGTARVISAVRTYGDGFVVLRPSKINPPANRTFELNLLAYSKNPTKLYNLPQPRRTRTPPSTTRTRTRPSSPTQRTRPTRRIE